MTDAAVPVLARPAAAVGAMAAILGVFVARPFLPGTWPLMALFVVLLAVGVSWPVAERPDRGVAAAGAGVGQRPTVAEGAGWGAVSFPLIVGLAAFALGRLLGGGHRPLPFRPGYVAAVTLAAVAEEAFFRRFVYAVLRPGGAALAVAGSAVLFAIAHVTVYGWWVLPLDLAAGLILSWQRWSTGTWAVPAVTHVAANLMIAL